MPCACQAPTPTYPENTEWGPLVWSILHGLAERVGRVMSPLFENDERRAWISFLQATGGMLPCEQCRDHYKAWIQKNPVSSIQTLPYNELKGFITFWIWNLHHDVNVRLGRFSSDTYVEPAYTDLATLYSSTALDSRFKILELIEKSAIRQQGVSLTGWMLWTKQFRTLVGVYGM